MTTRTQARLWYALVWVIAIGWFIWAADAVAGGGSRGDCNGEVNCNELDIDVEGGRGGHGGSGGDGGQGGSGGHGGSGGEGGEAAAAAEASAGAEASTGPIDNHSGGGNATVSTESNNTNVVLVPNNNTAGCLRVWGLAFGNGDGAASLGIPTRDKACDYEAAADDAAATGDHDIAWFWRCHKRSLYSQFKDRGEDTDTAVLQCFQRMTEMLGVPIGATDEPPPGQILVAEEEYSELLAQAETAEAVEEFAEQTEYRIAQQQNLIDSLQDDHEADQLEIERLKREAAALRAAQEADEERVEQRQMALQEIYERRVAQEEEEPPQEEEEPHE